MRPEKVSRIETWKSLTYTAGRSKQQNNHPLGNSAVFLKAILKAACLGWITYIIDKFSQEFVKVIHVHLSFPFMMCCHPFFLLPHNGDVFPTYRLPASLARPLKVISLGSKISQDGRASPLTTMSWQQVSRWVTLEVVATMSRVTWHDSTVLRWFRNCPLVPVPWSRNQNLHLPLENH